MRKKSHVSLALQIYHGMEDQRLLTHKIMFCIGSILPDCVPSFLTTPHRMDCTYKVVQERMNQFLNEFDCAKGCNYRKTIQLGRIAHYIADYFTFPHNNHYEGSLMDHCHYENDLKHELKRYIKSREALEQIMPVTLFHSRQELKQYIEDMHAQYVKSSSDIYNDCKYIVTVCMVVVQSMLSMSAGCSKNAVAVTG